MKILLLGFGSRGDLQPILPLAEGLRAAGYAVQIGAGSNFQSWVEGRGFAFADVGMDMQKMLSSDLGKEWTESSTNPAREARNMKRVMDAHSDAVGTALLNICAGADVLVSNLPTFGMAQAIAEKYGKRHIRVMLAPLTPSADPAATMIPVLPRHTSGLNRLSNYAGIYFIYWINRASINAFRRRLGLAPWNYGDFTRAWNRMPVLYGVSPLLMPRDAQWRADTVVTGFWFDAAQPDWQPSAALTDFLERYPRPVYLGFGSMAAKNPSATLAVMLEALAQTGLPGIIYSGWAELATDQLPPHALIIDGAPHDWLLPRMGALIHHGGSGTTAAGLRAGVPATVVAHMADQPYWGRRLHELGVGAKPIPRHKLTATGLAQAMRAMTGSSAMQSQAVALGQQIRQEQGVANAVRAIQNMLAD